MHRKAERITPANWRSLDIPVRQMQFPIHADLHAAFPGRPAETLFLLELSYCFPEGERFFVDAVLHFRDRVRDDDLMRHVRAFAGQEMQHSRQHRAYNESLSRGLLPYRIAERNHRWALGLLRAILPAKARLAVTVAMEHLTAIIGHQFLSNPAVSSGADPEHRALWMWHAVEETEHKAVAFEVYQAAGGGYLLRAGALAVMTALLVPLMALTMGALMALDHRFFCWRDWRSLLSWTLGKQGLMRGAIPMYLHYYRPAFHPWDEDNAGLIAQWKNNIVT
jgi:predicted metal-dependent hydrolase